MTFGDGICLSRSLLDRRNAACADGPAPSASSSSRVMTPRSVISRNNLLFARVRTVVRVGVDTVQRDAALARGSDGRTRARDGGRGQLTQIVFIPKPIRL